MKMRLINRIGIGCAAALFALNLTACGVDPNVKQPVEETSAEYVVETTADAVEEEREGFHAYGSGKTDPVTVDGVEIAPGDFAVRSYELAYMLAQPDFSAPEEIPMEAAVQYGFAHVYFDDLHSITNKAMQYRTATEKEIREKLVELFGTDDYNVRESVLYNPEKELFEMWIPEYGTNIYYTVDAVNVSGSQAEIITTFYNEISRSTMLGRTTLTVAVKDAKPVIAALKSE